MSRLSRSQPIIRFPTDEIIQIDLASQNNNDHLPEIPDPLDPQNDLNILNSVLYPENQTEAVDVDKFVSIKKLHSGYIVLFHGHGQVLSSLVKSRSSHAHAVSLGWCHGYMSRRH